MNDMKNLEIHLRSWAPRRPSARLERRLFAAEPATNETATNGSRHSSHYFGLRWLAPATATMLLLFVLYSQRNDGAAAGPSNSTPLVAMILSNSSAAAYLPASFHREQNGPPADTFEWTNGSGSTSSIRSLSGSKAQN